jgi:hypothetical protein
LKIHGNTYVTSGVTNVSDPTQNVERASAFRGVKNHPPNHLKG